MDGSPVGTSALGSHSFTVTARDVVGNTSSVTHRYTVVDGGTGSDGQTCVPLRTARCTSAGASRSPADFSCRDEVGGSGLASCVGTVADGSPGRGTSAFGVAQFHGDGEGCRGEHVVGDASATRWWTSRIRRSTCVPLPDGAVYERGQSVIADFSCRDEVGGSGLASCVGTVADGSPVGTSALGSHSFTVTARDVAGNTSSVTHRYTVVDVTDPTVDYADPHRRVHVRPLRDDRGGLRLR